MFLGGANTPKKRRGRLWALVFSNCKRRVTRFLRKRKLFLDKLVFCWFREVSTGLSMADPSSQTWLFEGPKLAQWCPFTLFWGRVPQLNFTTTSSWRTWQMNREPLVSIPGRHRDTLGWEAIPGKSCQPEILEGKLTVPKPTLKPIFSP